MGILVIALRINPRPLSSLKLKLSGLIMESWVYTAGDNQNAHVIIYICIYEGRSKSSRKSAIIFLFCKSDELNYYSYIDKHDLYLYNKFAALA